MNVVETLTLQAALYLSLWMNGVVRLKVVLLLQPFQVLGSFEAFRALIAFCYASNRDYSRELHLLTRNDTPIPLLRACAETGQSWRRQYFRRLT